MEHRFRQRVSLLLGCAVALLLAGPIRSAERYQAAYRIAESLEIKVQEKKPDWADPPGEPLFTFSWISDIHLNSDRLKLAAKAFEYVDTQLKPDFVIITGDNNSYGPEFTYKGEVPSAWTRRQLFFKKFLEKNLKAPAVVIPGDDWPWDFEKVFGAFQFSFDYGGLHFLFSTLDRAATGTEGCAIFEESTWKWMREDLAANRDRPTIFLMHETILPPTFLEAGQTRRMLDWSPNVIACFCGHMHVDLEFQSRGVKYLICPGLGPNGRHGLKHLKVYRHAIILTTHELDATTGEYGPVNKWQRIDIPERLRGKLCKPPEGGFCKEDYREIPAHPRIMDQALNDRISELIRPLMMFSVEFGVKGMSAKPGAE